MMTLQDKTAYFYITVKPKAAKNIVTFDDSSGIVAKVTAPPVDGKANEAIIKLFAETLRLPKSAITIEKGSTGKVKKIAASGINDEELTILLKKYIKVEKS